MDGLVFLREIKKDKDLMKIPVHIISARQKDTKVMSLGAIGYAQKPVNSEEIINIVKAIDTVNENKVKNLLIVEDDTLKVRALNELIGDGVNIQNADGLNEAIELLKSNEFDIVIIEMGMSGERGFKVYEYIKNYNSNLPVIFYTSREFNDEEKKKIQQYNDIIILKTAYSNDRILSEIDTFLHKNIELTPSTLNYNNDINLNGLHILVVDDDIKNIFVLTAALQEVDAKVTAAYNGLEAIKEIKADKSIDLVLMDIMMPVMDGYEAIRTIRLDESISGIPIIALTAKAMQGDRQKSIDAGADDYVSKPVDIDSLVLLIKAWSNKKQR
jgi:CheY-like chemotaxis protein